MNLIERGEALAALERLRADAAAGRGSAVVVSGPAAMGKSSLLDAFAERLADARVLPMTAAASDAERRLPLAVFAQFVLSVSLPAEDRDRLNRVLQAATGATRQATGDSSGRLSEVEARIAHQLCTELLGIAERYPLAIIVDDVHHADALSKTCLSYLVRRLHKARIIAVFAHAAQAAHPAQVDSDEDFRLSVLRQPHGHELALRPLSRAGVATMAASRLGESAAEAAVDDLLEYSGGNPLLVAGLLTDCQSALRGGADSGDAAAAVIGEGYAQAVLSCLRHGGPEAIRVGKAAAILGGGADADRLLAPGATPVAVTLRALESAGVLYEGRFRHPMARDAVLAEIPPATAAELHLKAAELGYIDGAAATDIARHLLAARVAPMPWAVQVLEDAALIALSEGSDDPAVEWLKLAYELCADESHRAKLMTTLMRAELWVNPSVPTEHISELLDALYAGRLDGTDTVVLTKALLWHGRFAEAADALAHLAVPDGATDPETLAELRIMRPWLHCFYAPLVDRLPQTQGTAEDTAQDWGDATAGIRRRFDAATALYSVLSKGPSEQVAQEAEQILQSTRLGGLDMDTVESALLALTYGERPQKAASWCDVLIEEAGLRESPGRQARLSAIRSEISLRQGDLPGAEQHARAALAIIPAANWGVALGGCLGSLVTALVAMGRTYEAAEMINQPVPDAVLESRFGLHYLRALGRWSLSCGDHDSALVDFQYCGGLMDRWNLDVPGLIAWRNDVAEAWLAIGERSHARTVLEDQLSRCTRTGSPRAHGTALRLLAAIEEPRQRPAMLRQAADTLQASGDRYALALALSDLTAAFHELGDPRRARSIGRQAWTIALECRAEPLVRLLAAESAEAAEPIERAGPVESPAGDATAPAAVPGDAEQHAAKLVALS